MFLSGKVSYCRFESLGTGDFATNGASKMHETSSSLGRKQL